MSVKVSIIVPVFNVAPFLRRCLESLIHQTLSEIEIILVNDCSQDNSELIITEYKKNDSRIVYLKHDENKGLGLTRNTGVKEAKGEYLLFVDSDDFIKTNTTEKLYLKAKELDLDILEANYYKITDDNKIKTSIAAKKEVFMGEKYAASLSYLPVVVWNKLWKKSFIQENNIKFFDGYFEDIMYTLKAMLLAKRVYQIDEAFYHYIIRDNSIMTSNTNIKHILNQQERIIQIIDIYSKNINKIGSDQRLKILAYAFSSLAYFITDFKIQNQEDFIIKKIAKEFLRKKHRLFRYKIINCNKLGIPQKILLFISPYLMNFILKKTKN